MFLGDFGLCARAGGDGFAEVTDRDCLSRLEIDRYSRWRDIVRGDQ